MHVVMLTNVVAPDKLGGLERYVRELSAALVRKDVHVTVASKRVSDEHPPHETGADGVEIVRHGVPDKSRASFAVRYPVHVARGVRSALRTVGPGTIVHGHYPFTTLPVALSRRRYIYTFHSPVYREVLDEREGSYALPGPAQPVAVAGVRATEALLLRRASHIFALSEYSRREIAAIIAAGAPRVDVVPGGLDTDHFVPGQRARGSDGEPGPLIVTARRLTRRTGVCELVAAMPQVLEHLPAARLVIAGDGSFRRQVESEIASRGLDDRVELLGRVPEDAVVHLYRQADLVVMPTQRLEGFGLTTAEALACGAPVVGTRIGATPEIIEPIDPALVADDPSPAGLATAIVRVLGDPALIARVRDAARNRVHPAMGWDVVAERHLDRYRAMRPAR